MKFLKLILGTLFIFSFLVTGIQAQTKKLVIGTIQIVDHPDLNYSVEGFKAALQKAGYIEGQNVEYIINKNPSGNPDEAAKTIKEYVDKQVNMIFAVTAPCALSAVKATSTIPIVFAAVRDPVETGIVKSIEKPGVNATGVVLVFPMYNLVRLAKEIIPGIKHITFIEDKNNVLKADMEQKLSRQVKDLELELNVIYISSKDEMHRVVDSLKGKTGCIVVNNNMEVMKAMDNAIQACLRNKIPLITTNEPSVEKGALATSAVDYLKEGKKAGEVAVRILEGASPSTIPLQEPVSYRLVINLKTAESLNMYVPIKYQRIADRLIK